MKYKAMTIIFALVLVAGFSASVASAKDKEYHGSGDPEGVRIKASFTLGFINTANTAGAANCGIANLPRAVTANGAGYSSKLGALSFALLKTMGKPVGSPDGTPAIMQGCATFKAPNGDALYADYAGNAVTGAGTLMFTGGTGRFDGATGSANFTGVFLVTGFPTTPPFLYFGGVASYLVEGTVYLAKEDEEDNEKD
jgi:hypothetical protein